MRLLSSLELADRLVVLQVVEVVEALARGWVVVRPCRDLRIHRRSCGILAHSAAHAEDAADTRGRRGLVGKVSSPMAYEKFTRYASRPTAAVKNAGSESSQMVQRPGSLSDRISRLDRVANIRLGGANCFRQFPSQSQLASQSRGESAAGSMGGTRDDALAWKNLFLARFTGRNTQVVVGIGQMTAGNYDATRA